MSIPHSRSLPSASVTRPADTTAYASGDIVANSTTAASVVPITLTPVGNGPGKASRIRRVRISKTGTSVTNASFRVHLFTTGTITCANGDNAAFSTNKAANYAGQIDVTVAQAFTDGAQGTATTDISVRGDTIYALLEARGAYTPISAEVITLTLEVEQD